MHRLLIVPVLVLAGSAAVLGAGPAAADTQPANLGNVANIERGNSEPGPHCHLALRAGGGAFDSIVTGAAHEGHTHTSGVFAATACP
jgi:hypothetical protein